MAMETDQKVHEPQCPTPKGMQLTAALFGWMRNGIGNPPVGYYISIGIAKELGVCQKDLHKSKWASGVDCTNSEAKERDCKND